MESCRWTHFSEKYGKLTGRICTELAKDAKSVIRVVCGIRTGNQGAGQVASIFDTKKYDDVIGAKAPIMINGRQNSNCSQEINGMIQLYLIRHSMTAGNLKKRYIGRTDDISSARRELYYWKVIFRKIYIRKSRGYM